MNPAELTGRARTHLLELSDPACALHRYAATAFLGLRRAAGAAGFGLEAVSAFRDFQRQIAIWNGKFSGDRPLHDANGLLLDAQQMSPAERVMAILLWSALPGASRHHWGTDLDLVDARVPPGTKAELVAGEFAVDGPFAGMSVWLEEHAARFGFFRPFRGVASGVQPEPWHYSFAPVAEAARRKLSPPVLAAALADAPLQGKAEVLSRLEEIHARYVMAIDLP
jgi:LAS superfamily LD-carboxypeptidase LdcB